jgi:RNA polymerase sigma-70 factor (ECF subfamily)
MALMATADIDAMSDRARRASALDDLEGVMRLYQPNVLRFVTFSVRDRDAALSITQDCFFKAYASRSQFRGECSVKTWLMRVAFNLVRSHARSQKLRFWNAASAVSVSIDDMTNYLPTGESSAETRLLAKERLEIVQKALEDLSAKQRSIFIMRFLEDLDIAEIALATGMQGSTVKTHLHRAISAIRARLGAKV